MEVILKKELYNYKARIIRVVDGDTVDAQIDCGFGIVITKRLRILDYDAPETWRPKCEKELQHGLKAKQKAQQLLEGKELYITTGKDQGVYGRYLANIELENGKDFAQYMKKLGLEKKESYN